MKNGLQEDMKRIHEMMNKIKEEQLKLTSTEGLLRALQVPKSGADQYGAMVHRLYAMTQTEMVGTSTQGCNSAISNASNAPNGWVNLHGGEPQAQIRIIANTNLEI